MKYRSLFYPMHLALLAVGENFFPMAWWTPLSKRPFRFLLAVDRQNYSLGLLRELGEAAICFLPWEERAWVVRAGYLTGRKGSKAARLGVELLPAWRLERIQVPAKALAVFELRTQEWPADGDHALFLGELVHVEGSPEARRRPILFLGLRNFATLRDTWRFR